MKKNIFIICCILFAFPVLAKNYDAFILNFLRVNPMPEMVAVHMVLAIPSKHTMEQNLQKGSILKFTILANLKKNRVILPAKNIQSKEISYYIKYDPLTRQYVILLEDKINLRGTDINHLFNTLIENITIEIPAKLIPESTYVLVLEVSIEHHTTASWMQKNLFLFLDTIIEPAIFEYEFDYDGQG